jgi:dihydrofolate reductase
MAQWMIMIAIIAAHDKNRVIGKEDRVPWRLAKDRVLLKELTLGNTVILGRKSYDSMAWYYDHSGRPMPGKTYIVVTHNPDYQATRPNAQIALSPQDALLQAKKLSGDAYVIGGEHIFSAFLPLADRLYLTIVDANVPGDAYFPKIDPSEWHEISHVHIPADGKNEYASDQITLERKR